jgi:hypothetical protein
MINAPFLSMLAKIRGSPAPYKDQFPWKVEPTMPRFRTRHAARGQLAAMTTLILVP